MNTYKPESQRITQEYRQLSLILEKKPLSSHDHQKLASGLSGGIDATTHALRVSRRTYMYRIWHATYLYVKSCYHLLEQSQEAWSRQMTSNQANKVFSERSTQIMRLERHKEPYNTAVTCNCFIIFYLQADLPTYNFCCDCVQG